MKDRCNDLRAQIGKVADLTRLLVQDLKIAPLGPVTFGSPHSSVPPPDRGEMIANAMLAFRHLEDARMRIGKAIQAYDGGVSVYEPKP